MLMLALVCTRRLEVVVLKAPRLLVDILPRRPGSWKGVHAGWHVPVRHRQIGPNIRISREDWFK